VRSRARIRFARTARPGLGDVTVLDAVLAALVVGIGSLLQGSVGFGVNLVATPLLLLVDERFVPAPVIIASTLLNVLVTRREGHGAVDPAIRTAIAGQVVGAVGAGAVIAALPTGSLSLLFAGVVLAGVALSVSGLHLRPTRRTLAGAGVASGFMGTVSGIGAPPIALVYQRSRAPAFRATLARYFLVGGLVALPVLAAAGELGTDELAAGAVLLPGTAVGFALSSRVVGRLDAREVRPVVLTLSAVSAVAVLVRELA
jgi:uncharacterized membrane protein YfcA